MSDPAPPHELIIAESRTAKTQCFSIRTRVFFDEQQFPISTEFDEHDDDPATGHILLRLTPSLEPIGTIRAIRPPGTTYYKLTRLAVLKDYRQYRFGRALVHALHDWVRRHVAAAQPDAATAEIVCHSQLYVKGFYAKFGYEPVGEEFDEDGAPHQKMVLRLPLHPST
ncbi:acyl-CoA N-acyltransferase [Schizophyllum commune]